MQASHSSLHKQGHERGHAYTSPSVIHFFVLRTTSKPITVSLLSSASPPTQLHLCSFAHKHSMMPLVITAGHDFRDNLETIYFLWPTRKRVQHFLDLLLKPIDKFRKSVPVITCAWTIYMFRIFYTLTEEQMFTSDN